MNEEPDIHVVYATDDGYLLPVKVSVASLICCAHEINKLRVHILDVGISNDN